MEEVGSLTSHLALLLPWMYYSFIILIQLILETCSAFEIHDDLSFCLLTYNWPKALILLFIYYHTIPDKRRQGCIEDTINGGN